MVETVMSARGTPSVGIRLTSNLIVTRREKLRTVVAVLLGGLC